MLPRLYRESPLNSIWEGAGNVNCLDVLRARAREPESLDAFLAELELAAGADPRLDGAVARLRAELDDSTSRAAGAPARRAAGALPAGLAAACGTATPAVAEAFCATRLGGEGGRAYGTLPRGLDCEAIVERHRPRV